MEDFLDELEKPAEAYRGTRYVFRATAENLHFIVVNLQDLRKGLTDLREGLKRIRQELGEHFADLDENDKYGKQMWAFITKSNQSLEDLVDDVGNAETTFTDAINYYGEEDKNMSSSEFYGIFKTFITSYRVGICMMPL